MPDRSRVEDPGGPTSAHAVLLVLPWGLRHVGGVNQVVERLGWGLLRERRWKVRVLVSGDPDAQDLAHEPPVPVDYVSFYGPLEGGGPLRALLGFVAKLPRRLRALRALLAREECRTVNVHYPSLAALHFVLLDRLGLWRHRLVLSFHLSDALQANETRGFERALWATLLRAADAIVIPSSDLGASLRAITPDVDASIVVIPNGVHLAQFEEPTRTPDAIPAALRGRPLIASVGMFSPRKGHADLLAALHVLKADFPGLGAIVLGTDTPYRAELERERHALGLDDDVAFFPDVPHAALPAFLHEATLFVLATRAETFCIALLEAGAARLPIVTTRVPGVVEVVRDRETALLCPVGDVAALAGAIRQVLDRPAESSAMAERFHGEIEQALTWDHHLARYQQLYQRLAT